MGTRHIRIGTDEIDEVILVATDGCLSGVYYPGHWTRPDPSAFGIEVDPAADPLLAEAAGQLRQYLAGERTGFDVPVMLHGNAFEERVWALLQAIPYGETRTYGELAEQLGDRRLARMVGRAVGHNPLSIVVGCHRVVGQNGRLTGYAGGLARKQFLLGLEAPARVSADALF